MSSQAAMSQGLDQRPTQQHQALPMDSDRGGNEDGVSIRPMRRMSAKKVGFESILT